MNTTINKLRILRGCTSAEIDHLNLEVAKLHGKLEVRRQMLLSIDSILKEEDV